MSEPWFGRWCDAVGYPQHYANRKLWEFAYISQCLEALELLEPGRRGLGFGVGREPLVAAFANRGVEVTATDLAPTAREARGWVRSGQHVDSEIEDLRGLGICDPGNFCRTGVLARTSTCGTSRAT